MDRVDLQNLFESILHSNNVYFQPPVKQSMNYPAIRYSLLKIGGKRANNKRYTKETGYNILLIDPNPDSLFVEPLLQLPFCKFDRYYVSENLNHFSFTIII